VFLKTASSAAPCCPPAPPLLPTRECAGNGTTSVVPQIPTPSPTCHPERSQPIRASESVGGVEGSLSSHPAADLALKTRVFRRAVMPARPIALSFRRAPFVIPSVAGAPATAQSRKPAVRPHHPCSRLREHPGRARLQPCRKTPLPHQTVILSAAPSIRASESVGEVEGSLYSCGYPELTQHAEGVSLWVKMQTSGNTPSRGSLSTNWLKGR
jgi:hypothetical protein